MRRRPQAGFPPPVFRRAVRTQHDRRLQSDFPHLLGDLRQLFAVELKPQPILDSNRVDRDRHRPARTRHVRPPATSCNRSIAAARLLPPLRPRCRRRRRSPRQSASRAAFLAGSRVDRPAVSEWMNTWRCPMDRPTRGARGCAELAERRDPNAMTLRPEEPPERPEAKRAGERERRSDLATAAPCVQRRKRASPSAAICAGRFSSHSR